MSFVQDLILFIFFSMYVRVSKKMVIELY